MDAPVVEVRYPTPPPTKFVPADDSVDMSAPVVRYPMPVQTMRVVDELTDDEGNVIDYSRSVGRYPTYAPRQESAALVREVEHVDPAAASPAPGAPDTAVVDPPVAAVVVEVPAAEPVEVVGPIASDDPQPATAPAAADTTSTSRRTRVRGGNG